MTVDVERVQKAVVQLGSSKEGRLAREEIEAGESLREVIHSYDLGDDDVEDLQAIRCWLQQHDELPDAE